MADRTYAVTATEFKKNYGYYAAKAIGGQTIIITKYGRETHVLMPYEKYQELKS